MRCALVLVLLLVCTAGCVPPGIRAANAEADILELRRDCLRRKAADPRVDCSQFQPTIIVQPRQ
jgi:hypothetical protein